MVRLPFVHPPQIATHLATLSKMVRASRAQSMTTLTTRGDGRLMSSRARRTAAIIGVRMATVEANLSLVR